MVAGMERYYQIARCYRDEDFRADRQPEFTQLDIEMSFVEQADVLELGEAVVREIWSLIGVELHTPFQQLTYAEAMQRFGTDKPDLRFGIELVECTDYFADTPFRVFQASTSARSSCPAARASRASSSTPGRSGPSSAAPAASPTCSCRTTARSPARSPRTSPRPSWPAWPSTSAPQPGDCVFFAAGATKPSRALLGAARLEIGRRCELIDESAWSFLWVVDAPLFEPAADAVAAGDVAVGAGAWTAVHHAFTSPKAEFLDTFDTDPGPALAYAYDMVCNGNEIGGGSIRIHRRSRCRCRPCRRRRRAQGRGRCRRCRGTPPSAR